MFVKLKLVLMLALFSATELFAGPAKIIVKGTQGEAYVYNSERGRGRRAVPSKKEGKETVVTLPEEMCADLLYLITDKGTSWFRVSPDETVVVNVGKEKWKFSGDQAAVNNYLKGWTQKTYFERPNVLINRVQMMMNQVPAAYKKPVDCKQFNTPEYIAWVKGLQPQLLIDLERAKLKDATFIKEHQERIGYVCAELQLQNYAQAKREGVVSAEAGDFARDLVFNKQNFLAYPGNDDMLGVFFDICDEKGWLPYDHRNFLVVRANRLANPEVRESYVLSELDNIVRNKWTYQTGEVFASVAGMMVTESGRQRYMACRAEYEKLAKEDEAGKPAFRFEFEDKNGKTLRLQNFKGKYLFIDIWATWCGPCKYQIPFVLQLEKELEGKDITFLSLSVDKQADKSKWLAMLKEFGLKGYCAISPDAFKYEMFQQYKVTSIPRFMLIDPEGQIVMLKARRPSDPVLKLQLLDILNRYEQEKSKVTGVVSESEGELISLYKRGGMTMTLDQTKVENGKFSLQTVMEKPGFLQLSMGRKFSTDIWVTPGCRMELTFNGKPVFSGRDAALNNFMMETKAKYASRYPQYSKVVVLDQKRSKLFRSIYDDIVTDINASALTTEEKRRMIGHFQGELLNQMYGLINASKVFGKVFAKPEIKKGYSTPVLDLQLVPEIVNHYTWLDGVQEFLYAQLEAGKVKIKGNATYLVDLAMGLSDPDMREVYLMEAMRMEILRGHVVGARERIAAMRPLIQNPANQKLLDEMEPQICKGEMRCQEAVPGTDLTSYRFANEKGKMVSLGDFKGKYVFIDLWSTGCNPCVGEIPYIKEMEHRFAGKPIAWVSLSLDLNEKEWKAFMVKNNMKGVQLLCEKGFKHPFIQQIGLTGIPRFVLLDKEGRMVDYNTLRPSNPVLSELLNILLK